jgi:CheY-like chemotaxis protein
MQALLDAAEDTQTELRQTAHTLKGLAKWFACSKVAESALALETAAKSAESYHPKTVRKLLDALAVASSEVREHINVRLEVVSEKLDLKSESIVRQPSLAHASDGDDFDFVPSQDRADVLIVEDAAVQRKILMRFFVSQNVSPIMAEDGLEALRLVESGQRFQLILVDSEMPGMDGPDATRAIRKFDTAVPIYAVTGDEDVETHARFTSASTNGIFTKPLYPTDIENLLAKRI